MRIVNRTEFLSLPSGTLYAKFKPQYFEGLSIKLDTWTNDWIYKDLLDNPISKGSDDRDEVLTKAEETGESFPLDWEDTNRDGLYDEDQLFAIYEQVDIEGLIESLQTLTGDFSALDQPIS